eukprot:4572044-Pyramimonas_sp.AAC.1
MLDLWAQIWSVIGGRGSGKITVLWTKSHATEELQEKFAIGPEAYFPIGMPISLLDGRRSLPQSHSMLCSRLLNA